MVVIGYLPNNWSEEYNFLAATCIHLCNSTNINWKNSFYCYVFSWIYSFGLYNVILYLLQSVDQGNHLNVDQTTTTSRKHVYLIVNVQFKYVKMFSYYVVTMSILVSLDNFFYVFYAGCRKGHRPISRLGQVPYNH